MRPDGHGDCSPPQTLGVKEAHNGELQSSKRMSGSRREAKRGTVEPGREESPSSATADGERARSAAFCPMYGVNRRVSLRCRPSDHARRCVSCSQEKRPPLESTRAEGSDSEHLRSPPGHRLLTASFASAAPDPTQPGPYEVGYTALNFDKTSATTGEPHRIRIAVWYPAVAGTGEPQANGRTDAQALMRQGRCSCSRTAIKASPKPRLS